MDISELVLKEDGLYYEQPDAPYVGKYEGKLSNSKEIEELNLKDGLYFKKSKDVPFTGQVDGDVTGFIKNGNKEGSWTYFHSNIEARFFKDQYYFKHVKSLMDNYNDRSFQYDNEQKITKGNYKNSKREGTWFTQNENKELVSRI